MEPVIWGANWSLAIGKIEGFLVEGAKWFLFLFTLASHQCLGYLDRVDLGKIKKIERKLKMEESDANYKRQFKRCVCR